MGNDITIQLSQGKIGLLSDCDNDLVAMKWYAWRSLRGHVYYVLRTSSGSDLKSSMHRVVLARMLGRALLRREHVDHINGDGLDNRRENLRLATASQNGCNRGSMSNNNSGYKGVVFQKNSKKWQAGTTSGGKYKYLGLYDNIIDAALAYDRYAYEHHGEFANCNYPSFASTATKDKP